MPRENYKKLMTENAGENIKSVLPLTEKQYKGFKLFCKRNDIPGGADRKKSFFVPSGRYGYSIRFIKTTDSGVFVSLIRVYIER